MKHFFAFTMNKIILCVALLFWEAAIAQQKLAAVFSDHMVLQRNAPLNIWGTAKPGETITIRFHEQEKKAVCNKEGKWLVTLAAETAGGPYTLFVMGKKSQQTLTDVLVGDVWLCSGQSNMEWSLDITENAEKAVAAANNPMIRHVKVARHISASPVDDIDSTQWEMCTPEKAGKFSAVGYYFAQSLQKELNIPIGLINSSWGGTIVETWISKSGLQSNAAFINIANQLPVSKEQFEKDQRKRILNDIKAFQQSPENEVAAGWEKYDYDDSRWSSFEVPKSWENQGLPSFDGTIWYRYTFTLTDNQVTKGITLHLGTIDDNDVTYVNGIKAGETFGWDIKRNYIIPAGILKTGKNQIAVKVVDNGGGGGFYGDAADVYIEAGNENISLSGKWKARVDVSTSIVSVNPNSMPSLLYNAMIHPLLNYAIKGAIWYQGESNADRAYQYHQSFPLLINDWRSKFKQPELPFYFVQLASFNANNENGTTGSKWAELRAAQLATLSLPHTGMAVTTDIGDAKDIHPKNKKDVGNRLALQVLKNEYGKNRVASGPVYKRMDIEKNTVRLHFDEVGSGLSAAGNKYGYLNGFMIAGADQQFKWAKATILDNVVVVWSEEVANPVAVRYGWMDDAAEANLVNKEGLPASPFRTDNWKLLTQDVKYILGQ